MENSVIMIAYAFPPEGRAGSHRPLRFVRQLSKTGWHSTVISVDCLRYNRYDSGLLASVPSGTEVIRARGRDVWQALQTWRGRQMKEKLSGVPIETVERIKAKHHTPF